MQKELFHYLVSRQTIATPRSMAPGTPIIKSRVVAAAFASKTPYSVQPKQVAVLMVAFARAYGNSGPLLGATERSYAIKGQYLQQFCKFLDSFPPGFYDEDPIKSVPQVVRQSCYSPKGVLESGENTERLAEAQALQKYGFQVFNDQLVESENE